MNKVALNPNLEKKLKEYREEYNRKEKELQIHLQTLEEEKEKEVAKVRENYENKKKNLGFVPVSEAQYQPSNQVAQLVNMGETSKAINQETEEINQQNFGQKREIQARLELLDKQCEIRVAQILETNNDYIKREKKKGEKELQKINQDYEKLRLYIARLKGRK